MNNTIKKLLAGILAVSAAFSIASCGTPTAASSTGGDDASVIASSEGSAPAGDKVVLKIGASPTPHAEILEAVKPLLAEQGIELDIVIFDDYVLPNTAVEGGEIDANFFQHLPYLDVFNEENGTKLVSAGAVHYEPMGIYPGKTANLADLPDGATIAIPNDGSNGARALILLQTNGIIKLKDGGTAKTTIADIIENPKNVKIEEVEAAQLPAYLPDVDFAVINGNYALGAGIDGKVLVEETSDSDMALRYANIIAVKEGNENNEAIVALVEALKSETAKEFVVGKFGKTVVIL